MILPIELDDALDALRRARDELGRAVDELHAMRAPVSLVSTVTQAMEAASWSVEHVSVAMAAHTSTARRDREEMLAVEERHVDCQTFPWTEDLG